jgi:hypothetical protein
VDFPLFGAAYRDFLFRPVDILKTQPTDFANAKTVDCAKQDRAATPDLNWCRAVDASYRVGKFGRGGTDDELEKPLNPV